MGQKVFNVLFLSSENSSRSIVAEAVLNHWGKGRFRAFSAGTDPAGEVDPLALELLKAANLSTEGLRSKNWREFAAPGVPEMDFVIDVGERRIAELQGALPGNPFAARWTITDPFAARDNPAERRRAYRRTFGELENRVRLFTLVRHEGLTPRAQQAQAL